VSLEKEVYLGLYLGGIKRDKSSLLVLEKYKDHNRLVISEIESKFSNSKKSFFPDEILKEQIKSYDNVKAIGANFPLTAPPCVECKRVCPGVVDCKVPEVKWLVREYDKASSLTQDSVKNRKIPSPYSERGLDYYIANLLEETFPLEPALGSSRSSFFGRGRFLQRGLRTFKFVETFPKAALWRLGVKYGLRKSVLRNFNSAGATHNNRRLFLNKIEKEFFIYEDDKEKLINSKGDFEALLSALSLYFYYNKKAENFPKSIIGDAYLAALPS
jgi:hypothetical protein